MRWGRRARELVNPFGPGGEVSTVVIFRPLTEGVYDEVKHPRGRGGKWIKKPGTAVGVTPYLKQISRAKAERVPRSHADAAALHSAPEWKPLMEKFERSAQALADHHGVEVKLHKTVGVFEGSYEPTYAVEARGKPEAVKEFAVRLGRQYGQKAVVGFTPGEGSDAEVRLTGGKDPDKFYSDLVGVMGKDAGITYEDGLWRVFVYGGDKDTMRAVGDLAAKHGSEWSIQPGAGFYEQLRKGEG